MRPFALVLEFAALAALVILGAAFLVDGRSVPLPRALADGLEARAAEAIGADLEVGALRLTAEAGGMVKLDLGEAALLDERGVPRIVVPRLAMSFETDALWGGPAVPRAVELEGAALRVVRRPDGTLDIGADLGPEVNAMLAGGGMPVGTPAEAVDALRALFTRPALAPLTRLSLSDLDLVFDDGQTGTRWTISDGTATLTRAEGRIVLALAARLPLEDAIDAAAASRLSLRLTVPEIAPETDTETDTEIAPETDTDPARRTAPAGRAAPPPAELSALVDGVPAADLAAQSPALAWLAPLDAPVSGTLIAQIPADGALVGALDGTLEIGAGRLTPAGGEGTVLDGARAYFNFRPETGRLTFNALRLAMPGLLFDASGHADLHGRGFVTGDSTGGAPAAGRPALDAVTAQMQINQVRIEAAEALPGPVTFDGGVLDAKLRLDPFTMEIGQIVLEAPGDEPARFSGRGRVEAGEGDWSASLDMALSELSPQRLLSFWPYGFVPRTRIWLDDNLIAARLADTAVGIRLKPGARPDVSLSFSFSEAVVQALRTLPLIERGEGFASITDAAFTLTVEEGAMTPPEGGPVALAGSVFRIPDTRVRPPDGELIWSSESTVTGALSLLDQPPFALMQKAGRPPALAEGRARLTGDIRFPIRRGVTTDAIDYDITGVLTDIQSDVLVPGRTLRAPRFDVQATPEGLDISGQGTLDGVPFDADWRQDFGADRPPARLAGRITLSPEAADAFDLGLPRGTLRGAASANLSLTMPAGEPAQFELTSDLVGLGLSIPSVGWSKSTGAAGDLSLAGTFRGSSAPPQVDRIALSAPGLDASGRLTLAQGGGLDRLELARARIGGWFDGPVTLRGRGAGRPPAVAINGGRADLRRFPSGLGAGSGGGGVGPRTLALDRLTLFDDIALTNVRAELPAGRASGTFSGRVNGGPAVSGTLTPVQGGRMALRVQTADAGRVLAAAGAFDEAHGGAMTLDLRPEGPRGSYRGDLTVAEMRLTSAPELAALLNTISVVGLLEQMRGPGLFFSEIQASFRLTPDVVQLIEASAVGPSVGLSADGYYDIRNERIDMQGVLSPIYALNSIGQIFTRQGEGLFGFNYRVRGPSGDPDVSVNPLSALTPGAFRQIFRADPPRTPRSGQ